MENNIAIKVTNVSKSFKLPHDKQNSIKGGLISLVKNGKRTYEKQEVLKDVSFEIKKGEFFGIVGRNGSGKSTLLKMLAGIYTPTSGHIQVNGSLTPFIELGVGFNPELTGRENVYLNGALLGFNRIEMEAMYDDIVEFAELERFMDQKLKNYSSGMQVRLAFSIAIQADSDILILDEVLAVGDEAFQRKCFDYFAQLKISKKTVILVTHGMDNVRDFCDRAMLLSDGDIEHIGKPQEITELYERANLPNLKNEKVVTKEPNTQNASDIIRIATEIFGNNKEPTNQFFADDTIHIEAHIFASDTISDAFLGISIHKPDGEAVYVMTTEKDGEKLPVMGPSKNIKVAFAIQNIFPENTYYISVSLKSSDRKITYVVNEDVGRFRVLNIGIHKTTYRPNCVITINKTSQNKN